MRTIQRHKVNAFVNNLKIMSFSCKMWAIYMNHKNGGNKVKKENKNGIFKVFWGQSWNYGGASVLDESWRNNTNNNIVKGSRCNIRHRNSNNCVTATKNKIEEKNKEACLLWVRDKLSFYRRWTTLLWNTRFEWT